MGIVLNMLGTEPAFEERAAVVVCLVMGFGVTVENGLWQVARSLAVHHPAVQGSGSGWA